MLLTVMVVVACGRENQCNVTIGNTNFQIEPNNAYYSELNNPAGW